MSLTQNGNRKQHKRRPRGRFGIVLADVTENKSLSLSAKGVYSILVSSMRDSTGYVKMSLALIAERANKDKRHVRRLLRELEGAGAIVKVSNDREKEISRWFVPTYENAEQGRGTYMSSGHRCPPIHQRAKNLARENPSQRDFRLDTDFDGIPANKPTPDEKKPTHVAILADGAAKRERKTFEENSR